MPPPTAYVSWSSGKDSAFALYEAERLGLVRIAGVLTTINEAYDRVAMHGVRSALLDRPLWQRDTTVLAQTMIASGLVAHIACLDPRRLNRRFAGRRFDDALLRELPEAVDPCGENGEFHTVVTAGPMFSAPIAVAIGETVERDGFVFTDVVPC